MSNDIPKAKKTLVVNAGSRVTPDVPEGTTVRVVNNKFARRMARKQALRSTRMSKTIAAAQKERAEASAATENGHAARRLLDSERKSRR